MYPNQMSKNMMSDQGLYCLLIDCSIKFENKYHRTTLKGDMEWFNSLGGEILFGLKHFMLYKL